MMTKKREKIYVISEILHQEGRGHVNAKVMEDFKCIVGEASRNKVVGSFDLCKRKERQDAHQLLHAI
jgi:hypothetical protein